MALDTSHIFTGLIGGKNISYDRLDYTIKGLENRLEFVDKLLQENDLFLQTYFDKYFVVNPTMWDATSYENNICKKLEQIATYLLAETPEKKSNLEYRFYTSERNFEQALKRELSLDKIVEDMSTSIDNTTPGDVMHFLIEQGRNQRLPKGIKVEDKDFNRQDELGHVLRQYKQLKDNLLDIKQRIIDGEYESKNGYTPNTTKLKYMINSIDGDMYDTKVSMLQPIELRDCANGSTVSCWDDVDFLNPVHVECFLKLTTSPTNFDSDLSMLLNYFNELLDSIKPQLNSKELEVLKILRWGIRRVDAINDALEIGFNQKQVRELYTITSEELNEIINKTVQLIMNAYEQHTRKFLDNKLKDSYMLKILPTKVCKTCGLEKTISSFHKDRNSHRTSCKTCNNASKKR